MASDKPHMNLVFIGHVDAGKSTTLGRLMFDSGNVSEQQMNKYKEMAKELGKNTFEFAFVMDRVKEERERGLTIDLAHEKYESKKFFFTMIDAPGHRDFVKNMITGASQADAAVLMVSAKNGVQPQTREHIFLARTLGVGQLIVCINQMDTVEYKEDVFKQNVAAVTEVLKSVAFNMEKVKFIPTSGLVGDNVFNKSDKMDWYKGPTLADSLDDLEAPTQPTDLALRVPIQDSFNITGVGCVPVGRVETGIMKIGDKVVFMPSGAQGEIKSIEMHHEQMQEAKPGDNIGFNVRGVAKKDVKRGDVMGRTDNPPTVAKEFTAQVVVLNHPTVITAGYTPVFHAHTAQIACRFEKILKKLDPKTGAVVAENPDFIKTGDAAIVKCIPVQPFVLESSKDFPPLGRFAIRDMGQTVAAGMVLEVVPK